MSLPEFADSTIVPRELLQNAGNALPELAMWAIGYDGRFTASLNKVFLNAIGYTRRELKGFLAAPIMRPGLNPRKSDPDLVEAMKLAQKEPGKQLWFTTWSATKSGDRVYFEGKVEGDEERQLWLAYAIVIGRERPAFDGLGPFRGEASVAMRDLSERLDALPNKFQRQLPGMPALVEQAVEAVQPGGKARHLRSLAELEPIFDLIASESPDAPRTTAGHMRGVVSIERIAEELGIRSTNTVPKRLKELSALREGETAKQALERLFDEHHDRQSRNLKALHLN